MVVFDIMGSRDAREHRARTSRSRLKKVLYSRNFTFSHGGDGDDVRCSKSDGVGETGDSGH